jgi:hypothetical protein
LHSEGKTGTRTAEIITFDETDSSDLKELYGKEFDAVVAPAAGDDDLLSLMDKAS